MLIDGCAQDVYIGLVEGSGQLLSNPLSTAGSKLPNFPSAANEKAFKTIHRIENKYDFDKDCSKIMLINACELSYKC